MLLVLVLADFVDIDGTMAVVVHDWKARPLADDIQMRHLVEDGQAGDLEEIERFVPLTPAVPSEPGRGVRRILREGTIRKIIFRVYVGSEELIAQDDAWGVLKEVRSREGGILAAFPITSPV